MRPPPLLQKHIQIVLTHADFASSLSANVLALFIRLEDQPRTGVHCRHDKMSDRLGARTATREQIDGRPAPADYNMPRRTGSLSSCGRAQISSCGPRRPKTITLDACGGRDRQRDSDDRPAPPRIGVGPRKQLPPPSRPKATSRNAQKLAGSACAVADLRKLLGKPTRSFASCRARLK